MSHQIDMQIQRGTHVVQSPALSIIIAAYNAERYLVKAIESVLSQTVSGIEIVIVDDGSTDGTAKVCKQYANHIIWVHQNNGGASAARNAALAVGTAPIFAVLDADDWLEPTYAAEVLEAFAADEKLDVVFCNTTYQGETARAGSTTFDLKPPPAVLTLGSALSPETSFCVAGAYRRRVIDLVGRAYLESLESAEDMEFFLRVLLLGGKFRFLSTPLYNYNLRPGSLTHASQKLAGCSVQALQGIRNDFALTGEDLAALDRSIEYYRRDWARAAMSDATRSDDIETFRAALRAFLRLVPAVSLPAAKGYLALIMSRLFPSATLSLLRRLG